MIQPNDLKTELEMELSNGAVSTTTKVWEILLASSKGDLNAVETLIEDCFELIYAQYNYTPPIHFAVREGHVQLVDYLLRNGAHDPAYRIYPFLDSLQTLAEDRGYEEIVSLLKQYAANPPPNHFKGDNGKIRRNRSVLQQEFERAVDQQDFEKTAQILKEHPEFATDESYFWGEGILTMPAKCGNFKLCELLMGYGAKVPDILKWTQRYYFERYDSAIFLLENGMNPNTMSWHHVTILHDMAQSGNLTKAGQLLKHGAAINAVEEEYQSTPLGMATRWCQAGMVKYLLEQGADPNKSGAPWATPLAWAVKRGHKDITALLTGYGAAK
jgi:ankyrin repeat protein